MPALPSPFKPSITQGYGFGQPDNVIVQSVQGGAPLRMLDFRTGPVSFNVSIDTDPLGFQAFQDFYFGRISSGGDEFTMNLDSGCGLEEHTVSIVVGSLNYNGDRAPIWTISFIVRAKTTPIQL